MKLALAAAIVTAPIAIPTAAQASVGCGSITSGTAGGHLDYASVTCTIGPGGGGFRLGIICSGHYYWSDWSYSKGRHTVRQYCGTSGEVLANRWVDYA